MLKRVIFIAAFLFSFVTHVRAEVVCNLFRIVCDRDGGTLGLYLHTDLPDNTSVSVSVTRSYMIKGNANRFAVAYFEGKSTVRKWRKRRRIPIEHEIWEEALKKKEEEFLLFGQEFELEEIDSRVSVRMKVLSNQPDPAFGDNNENLKGIVVKMDKYPTVEQLLYISYPIPVDQDQ